VAVAAAERCPLPCDSALRCRLDDEGKFACCKNYSATKSYSAANCSSQQRRRKKHYPCQLIIAASRKRSEFYHMPENLPRRDFITEIKKNA
jgi:hypothetical protein